MQIYTVSFFGHRRIADWQTAEKPPFKADFGPDKDERICSWRKHGIRLHVRLLDSELDERSAIKQYLITASGGNKALYPARLNTGWAFYVIKNQMHEFADFVMFCA